MAAPLLSVAVRIQVPPVSLAKVDIAGASSPEWAMLAVVVAFFLAAAAAALLARNRRRFEASNAALRENQQLLASITDNIAEAIYRTEPNGRLVFVNRAYLRLFGYETIEELNALPRERLYAKKEDRLHLLRQLEEKATFANEELEFVRKDGSRFWGLISSTATRDGAGRPVFFDGIISDVTERKLAETKILDLNQSLEVRISERTAELSASEARLRTLVDHAPEAIVVFDDDTGRFIQCNENALRLYGFSEPEMLRVGFADVSPDQQPDGHRSIELARQRVREALSGEAPVFEWVQRHSSGRLFSCEVRLVRLPAEGRHLIRGSIIDNTERHRRERIQQATYQISEAVNAAQDLESLYPRIHAIIRGLMEADNFYIALYDERTERVSFPYWVDEKDLRPAPAALNAGLTSWVIRSGKPILFSRAANSLRRLASGSDDEPHVESGTPAAVRIGAPMKTGGRILGVIAVQHYEDDSVYGDDDKQMLTFVAEQTAWAIERKRAERALRESEEKHRVLFEASAQGVMLLSGEQLLEVNPAAVRILGFQSPDQLVGLNPLDLTALSPEENAQPTDLARLKVQECIHGGSSRFEWAARTPAGADIALEIILTRIPTSEGFIIQAVVNDITDRKRAQDELLKALAHEKELGLLKTNFVSMVSHEFRTPLGIILSSTQILTDYHEELAAAERADQLASIHKNVRRMAGLIDEVLLLGRVEAGRVEFKPETVDLAGLCRRMADEVGSSTDARCPIMLTVPVETIDVSLDERLLNHVFTNILSNAVKYSPAGAPVQFRCGTDGDDAVFVVQDEGVGIPDSDQPWLFQAFHRGRNVANIPGTGLGLTIVKRCVELHGGDISIDSAVGRGTTVTVRVPAQARRVRTLDPGIETADRKGATA